MNRRQTAHVDALNQTVALVKAAATDPHLSDARARGVVRYLTSETFATWGQRGVDAVVRKFGWERARLTPPTAKERPNE